MIVHEGEEYDSKAIAGVAHGIQHPEMGPLTSGDFTGGGQTVSKLRSLGFEVVRKSGLDSDDEKNSWDAWLTHCSQIAAREDFDANERTTSLRSRRQPKERSSRLIRA